MKNNKLVRLFVLLTLLIASTTSVFAWSFDEMRYELEYGIKAKDFDVVSGASDRSFREMNAGLTVYPFEESEFSITGNFAKRVWTNSGSRSNNSSPGKSENEESISRELTVGNTWIFGKLMLRPELGMRYTNYKYNSRVDKTIEYRLYPKITYSFTNKISAYTRGYFGLRDLDRKGTAKRNDDIDGKQKSRMEYGVRYKFNNKNALSVAFGRDRTEETHRDYEIKINELRLRYHWTPNRKVTVVPHWFIGTSGSRLIHAAPGTSNHGKSGEVSKSRIGINTNFKATNSITVLAQIHYEWWRVTTKVPGSRYPNAVPKDNMFYHLGLKHTF